MNDSPNIPFDPDDDDDFRIEGFDPADDYLAGDDSEICDDCGAPTENHEYGLTLERFKCEVCGETLKETDRAAIISIALILAPPKNVMTLSNPMGLGVHERCLASYFNSLFDSTEDPTIPLPFQYEDVSDSMDDVDGHEAFTIDEVLEDDELSNE
jgi:hypothetical protein